MTTTDDRQQQVTFPSGWFTHEQYTTDEGRALAIGELGEHVTGTTAKVVVDLDSTPRRSSVWLEVGRGRSVEAECIGETGTLYLTFQHDHCGSARFTYLRLPGISPEGLIAALQQAVAERRDG